MYMLVYSSSVLCCVVLCCVARVVLCVIKDRPIKCQGSLTLPLFLLSVLMLCDWIEGEGLRTGREEGEEEDR